MSLTYLMTEWGSHDLYTHLRSGKWEYEEGVERGISGGKGLWTPKAI